MEQKFKRASKNEIKKRKHRNKTGNQAKRRKDGMGY